MRPGRPDIAIALLPGGTHGVIAVAAWAALLFLGLHSLLTGMTPAAGRRWWLITIAAQLLLHLVSERKGFCIRCTT